MKEIAKDVFIENSYAGVILGVVRTAHGLIMIDAPFRLDDIKAWKTALDGIGGGPERVLVNLDTHLDRTLGVKHMDSMVITHQKAVSMIKSRPNAAKAQEMEALAMYESYDGFSNIRWLPPEINFQQNLMLEWGSHHVLLEHHAGSNAAGIWAIIPDQKVIFVGDSVLVAQPPFLAFSDLTAWLEDLKLLTSAKYKNYQIVSGRDGVITIEDVREMAKQLRSIQRYVSQVHEKGADTETLLTIAGKLMKFYEDQPQNQEIYLNRLRWGLTSYCELHKE